MPVLSFPGFSFRIKTHEGGKMIFDVFRRKYVSLTPEEWVRQNMLHFLVEEKKYPRGLIGVEKEIKLNRTKRRYDAVVFSRTAKPVMLVECKSPDVKINQDVFNQILRYNIALKVPYLLVTNGKNHYICKMESGAGSCKFLNEIPSFGEIEKIIATMV
ncbi:MAG: type I restriction enzyme HsdR N-terminal domain-containing protein [Bacteroidetes bacterium]|nr:type I restriction enzyme HsdR N-terminal domain-containing protein [Bacteroidota bacterium]